jgi:eukaryotic-like serine/threonine-protein kinase
MSRILSMSTPGWSKVRSLFGAVLDLAIDDRLAALDRLDREHPDAAPEVRRLVENYREARSFLSRPVSPEVASALIAVSGQTVQTGDVLANRYEIRSLIGAGGMGEVYEARDREMRVPIALKVLPPQLAVHPEMVERFLKEVYLAREVAHPGICKTYDLGRSDIGNTVLFFLTMELIDGETLASRLSAGRIPADEGERILKEAAEAVAAAHQIGVIHRDLKPGNVMLRRQPLASGHRVSVMDFGLAKGAVPESLEQTTGSQHQVGTPQYMAPEQLANDQVTKATDVYALGLIAYEVLTGRRPLDQDPPLAALIKRSRSAPPEPSSIVRTVPARWNRVIVRCLDPDPAMRYADAAALVKALESSRGFEFRVPWPSRFTRRQVAMFAGGAIATVAAVREWWPFRPEARVAPGTRVLLMPSVNATGEAELNGVAMAFAAEIQQSAHLAFSQPEDHPEELKLILKNPGDRLDPRTARHLALRTQIPLVLYATLAHVGSEYVFDLTLERVDPSTERPAAAWPASFRAEGHSQLNAALFDAARWLRRSTGESEASMTNFGKRPEEVTTDSWEALREFSDALNQAETDLAGAIVTLDAAVRRDPLFAMAQMRRGDYLIRLNRFAEGYEAWRAALHSLDQRPISRREELMIRAMYADDMQAIQPAVGYYRELMRIYPYVDYPWRYVSSPLMKMGRLEESIAVMEQLIQRTGGSRWNYWRKLLDYHAIAGHAPAAHAAWEEMRRRQPPSGEIELGAFVMHAAAGEDDAAESAIRDALPKLAEANRSKYTTTYAHWLADRGRMTEAAQLLHDYFSIDARAGRDAERARKLVSYAAIESRIGGSKAVRTACLEAIDLDRGPQRVRRASVILARAGHSADAVRGSGVLNVAGGEPLCTVAQAVINAEVHLSQGAFAAALEVLQPVAESRSHTESRLEYARALAGTGRRGEAIRLLEDALLYRHSEWVAADLAIPLDYSDAFGMLGKLKEN